MDYSIYEGVHTFATYSGGDPGAINNGFCEEIVSWMEYLTIGNIA